MGPHSLPTSRRQRQPPTTPSRCHQDPLDYLDRSDSLQCPSSDSCTLVMVDALSMPLIHCFCSDGESFLAIADKVLVAVQYFLLPLLPLLLTPYEVLLYAWTIGTIDAGPGHTHRKRSGMLIL